MTAFDVISPDWPMTRGVHAFTTTRTGGASEGPYASLNLSSAVDDDAAAVAENRARLTDYLPSAPRWLKQVHGDTALHLGQWRPGMEADAAWTDRPGQVAAVLTADCLPVVFAHRDGGLVAVAHAGWQGLACGVLPATVQALPAAGEDLAAWIGPCIGPKAFEVGEDVREAFGRENTDFLGCFKPVAGDKYLGDLPAIARMQLAAAGVTDISGGEYCTASDPERFFSYRRDGGTTGRMATVVWFE